MTAPFHLIAFSADAMRSGKTTAANALEGVGYEKVAFAAPLKVMIAALLRYLGMPPLEVDDRVYGHRKDEIIPGLGVTTRRLMQTLGTEWGRDCLGEDFWVKIGIAKALGLKGAPGTCGAVFDDARFPNEADAIREAGGHIVRVIRPGLEVTEEHPSEGQLRGYRSDRQIVNADTMEALERKVLQVRRELRDELLGTE